MSNCWPLSLGLVDSFIHTNIYKYTNINVCVCVWTIACSRHIQAELGNEVHPSHHTCPSIYPIYQIRVSSGNRFHLLWLKISLKMWGLFSWISMHLVLLSGRERLQLSKMHWHWQLFTLAKRFIYAFLYKILVGRKMSDLGFFGKKGGMLQACGGTCGLHSFSYIQVASLELWL